MADYTAKELHKVMLKIFNSDKDGGYTSKEMTEIFGKHKKNEILQLNPDVLMSLVKASEERNKIKAGTVLKFKAGGGIHVCTMVNNIGFHTVKEDGTTYWFETSNTSCFEVLGEMNINFIFNAMRRYKNSDAVFSVGDFIKTKEKVAHLADYAAGMIKGSVVYRDENQMKVVMIEHEKMGCIGKTYWLTNTSEYYEKV